MKKLAKLKLHDVSIMNDREMKSIVGSYGEQGGYGGGGGDTCHAINASSCGGTCTDREIPIFDSNGKRTGSRAEPRYCRGQKPEGSDTTYIICGCL